MPAPMQPKIGQMTGIYAQFYRTALIVSTGAGVILTFSVVSISAVTRISRA